MPKQSTIPVFEGGLGTVVAQTLGVESVRKKRFDVLEAGCLRQFGEDVSQVVVGIEAVGLRRLNEGVEIGARFRSVHGIARAPVRGRKVSDFGLNLRLTHLEVVLVLECLTRCTRRAQRPHREPRHVVHAWSTRDPQSPP